MDAHRFATTLRHLLLDTMDALEDDQPLRRVETFEEAGVLTSDAGLVVELTDASEYQITIVRSRS